MEAKREGNKREETEHEQEHEEEHGEEYEEEHEGEHEGEWDLVELLHVKRLVSEGRHVQVPPVRIC